LPIDPEKGAKLSQKRFVVETYDYSSGKLMIKEWENEGVNQLEPIKNFFLREIIKIIYQYYRDK
jgi:hypothetical protein